MERENSPVRTAVHELSPSREGVKGGGGGGGVRGEVGGGVRLADYDHRTQLTDSTSKGQQAAGWTA